MDEALRKQWMMVQQDQQISEAIEREKPRLHNFIRRRVRLSSPGGINHSILGTRLRFQFRAQSD
jgi:hypothetical protein